MPRITVDSRENNEHAALLKRKADAVELIEIPSADRVGVESADSRIERDNPPFLLLGERKRWDDWLATFFDSKERGRLERQLSNVDYLVIEGVPGKFTGRYSVDMQERAYRHLVNVSMNMPVVPSANEAQTWLAYEYLARAQSLTVRQKSIVKQRDGVIEATLKLLGTKPYRPLRAGGTLISNVAKSFPVDAMAAWVDSWAALAGIGPKTIQVAKGRLAKAADEALGIKNKN